MIGKKIHMLTAIAVLATTPALAAEPVDGLTIEADSLVPERVNLPLAAVAIDEPGALSDDELSALRGGESLVVSNQTMVAITTGNVITGDYTAGSVSLSDHALSSFNGVGNLLINTGGQVALQSGMNLTINVGD